MKKIILTLGALLIIHFLHAQQLQYSVEGGINFSGAYAVENGMVIKGGPLPGFQLGVSATKIITQKISFQSSLLFFYGGTYRTGIDVNHTKYHASLLKLPLDVVYHKGGKFFVGIGPFIGYAISGTHTLGGRSYKIIFGSDPNKDDSRRLDAGLDAMAEYVFTPNLFLKACLDVGLINPALPPLRVNTRTLGIMVAYLLK